MMACPWDRFINRAMHFRYIISICWWIQGRATQIWPWFWFLVCAISLISLTLPAFCPGSSFFLAFPPGLTSLGDCQGLRHLPLQRLHHYLQGPHFRKWVAARFLPFWGRRGRNMKGRKRRKFQSQSRMISDCVNFDFSHQKVSQGQSEHCGERMAWELDWAATGWFGQEL